jgi:nucleoside 2-deoxyribosyltransferase
MNIYFACSITGGREFEPTYRAITTALLRDGHQVPTAHLADSNVKVFEELVNPLDVYTRDTAWIRACEALVAEVSTPSHGVGYEIAYALNLGKPVLCVYHEGQPISKMLTGNSEAAISVMSYGDDQEVVKIIRSFLRTLI